jgi:methylisocitrate lyase
MESPGSKFRQALLEESPLQIAGTVNAYVALMAKRCGFKAIYLSGAGIANSSYGLPDLALTTLDNVLEDVRRLTAAVDIPLLVDIDTGWGGALMVQRTIQLMEKNGAAAVHLEDQIATKRCGHRPGKQLISQEAMVDKIKAAVDAKRDPSFVIMARTDALAVEGWEKMVERLHAYVDAGADMLFPEALTNLQQFKQLRQLADTPLLANVTEFGQTPLFTRQELADAGVDMALYPLSANRAMNLAALKVLETIKQTGTQKPMLEAMQTREELYGFLEYEQYETRV